MADRPVGRPPREYTPEQLADITKYARQGCHTLTIANITGIPEATLRDNFREVLTKERALHKADIRLAQNNLVEEGNATMAIWLGKQELEQTDKSIIEQTTNLKMYGQEANVEEV